MQRRLFDPKAFDPANNRDWFRLHRAILLVEYEEAKELAVLEHNHWVTLAANSGLDAPDFERVQKNATAALLRVQALMRPWEKIKTDIDDTLRDTMREAWIASYGDPADPEVAKNIADLLASFDESYKRAHGGA